MKIEDCKTSQTRLLRKPTQSSMKLLFILPWHFVVIPTLNKNNFLNALIKLWIQ